jgi:serine/threonine protein kinase
MKGKVEAKQPAATKKKQDAGVRRSSFLIRVQLCEERIRMQLTDHDTRVGVVLDLLRARCPGYRIDALSTFDGCEMQENDKIIDLCDYGECVVVTSGRTAAARTASAVLSSFGTMSCMPRPCVLSMPAHVSKKSGPGIVGPCLLHKPEEKAIKEIFVAINGDLVDTVMVPVRLNGGGEGGGASLTCRGGVGTSWMRRFQVAGEGSDDHGQVVKTVKDLQEWVRQRAGGLAGWCRLYTHVCTPPPRPPADGGLPQLAGSRNWEPQVAIREPKPAATSGAWWGEPLRESAAIPVLSEGQRLVVCTKSYGVTVNSDMWPGWKCMPLNLTGPERLRHGDNLVLHDPVRHDEITALLKLQETRYPWLKHMQRCGSEMLHGGILMNDEVSFASVMSHSTPPTAFAAGRLSLKVVTNGCTQFRRASGEDSADEAERAWRLQGFCTTKGQTATMKQISSTGGSGSSRLRASDSMMWEDESVWANLPAHAHVLTLLFTAGPQLLFCSYMDLAPVTHWLLSCPVQALDAEEMLLVYRTMMLQTAMALEHFHANGALHLGVQPDNLLVRPCTDMRQPLWKRMHVVLADFGLSSRDNMAGWHAAEERGGTPGYWPPEQVPLDHVAADDRWGDSPLQLRLAFEMFIEGVHIERGRHLKEVKEAKEKFAMACAKEGLAAAKNGKEYKDFKEAKASPSFAFLALEPEFPRLPSSSWAWFKQANLKSDVVSKQDAQAASPRTSLQEVEEELLQVVAEEEDSVRRALWRDAVQKSGDALNEHADSFSLGMTMIYLIGHAIRDRVKSAEAKANRQQAAGGAGTGTSSSNGSSLGAMGSPGSFRGVPLSIHDQTANEWQRVVNDDLAAVLGSCIRLKARERMLAAKIVWELQAYPSYARRLWLRMAGNDVAPWKGRYGDEPLCDMPSLLNIARARVYACMKLMSIDDPQTRRAQAAMVQLLVLTQAQVLPDLSIKPLNAATLADELLRGAENLVQWFHTHGKKSSRVFYVVTLSSKYTRALTFENVGQVLPKS